MHILDTHTLVSLLTNADDPLYHDHKRISRSWVGDSRFSAIHFRLAVNPSSINKFFCF